MQKRENQTKMKIGEGIPCLECSPDTWINDDPSLSVWRIQENFRGSLPELSVKTRENEIKTGPSKNCSHQKDEFIVFLVFIQLGIKQKNPRNRFPNYVTIYHNHFTLSLNITTNTFRYTCSASWTWNNLTQLPDRKWVLGWRSWTHCDVSSTGSCLRDTIAGCTQATLKQSHLYLFSLFRGGWQSPVQQCYITA